MASIYPPGYLDSLAKPLMIGALLSPPLYGIGLAQALYYYRSFPKDAIYVKAVVGILLVLDTAHLACHMKSMNEWFLVQLMTPNLPLLFCISLFFAYTTIFIVQCAYAARVWILSKKNLLITTLVVLLAMGQLAGGLGQAISTIISKSPQVSHTSPVFAIAGKIELSCSLACDFAITGAMVYFLRTSNSGSGIQRTSEVVNKIIVYSISVGLFTSVGTVINIALWLGMPQNFDFIILHLILSKLYFNSLLVMLNSRVKLRQRFFNDDAVDLASGKTITLSTRN
ncbi:hypothetical protein C8R44DRAFT_773407 [Mycena epipterygia]|nr:hypothetical protein C8R44DRAFT_773407 [Mycena epipterygia]